MNIHFRIGLVFAASAVCAALSRIPAFAQAPGDAAPGGAITLTLHRPDRVNDADEVRYERHDVNHYKYTKMGTPLKQFVIRSDVEADFVMRVLAVDENQDAVKFRVFVKSLHATREFPKAYRGKLPPNPAGLRCQGATLIVTKDPKLSFSRTDGKALTEADIAHLRLFFSQDRHRSAADLTALDPDHPVSVGDSWNPDEDAVSRLVIKKQGLDVEPGTLTVSETFTDRGTVQGMDAATMTLQVSSDSVTLPKSDDLLDDPSGNFSLTEAEVVPVDPTARYLGSHSHEILNYSGLSRQPNLEGVEYDYSGERDRSYKVVRILP